MFSVVLALALAFDQQVTVRVGGKPDSDRQVAVRVLADTIDDGQAAQARAKANSRDA